MPSTNSSSDKKIWLITGCSSGLGRALAEAVLARGDKLVLTARDPATVEDLAARYPDHAVAVKLDVTREGDPAAAVKAAQDAFGGIDVLVNNAGFGMIGAVEETAPDEYRPMFEANVYGLIEMTRAALPVMRQRTGGRIVQISSNLGIAGRAGFGLYSASKFAVEGLSEALAGEVEPHGIAVIIVEPGAFRTDFLGRSIGFAKHRIAAYDKTSGLVRDAADSRSGKQPGDPARGIAVLIQAIDAAQPPLRLPLGPDAFGHIRKKVARVTVDLDAWETIGSDVHYL